jgi:hypothetical protein
MVYLGLLIPRRVRQFPTKDRRKGKWQWMDWSLAQIKCADLVIEQRKLDE